MIGLEERMRTVGKFIIDTPFGKSKSNLYCIGDNGRWKLLATFRGADEEERFVKIINDLTLKNGVSK